MQIPDTHMFKKSNVFFKEFQKIEIFYKYWKKINYLIISAHLLHKFVFCFPLNVNS